MLIYDQLTMGEFVSGYLKYLKTQRELSKTSLLTHLQLLMDKATTYSCPSTQNFTSPSIMPYRTTETYGHGLITTKSGSPLKPSLRT